MDKKQNVKPSYKVPSVSRLDEKDTVFGGMPTQICDVGSGADGCVKGNNPDRFLIIGCELGQDWDVNNIVS